MIIPKQKIIAKWSNRNARHYSNLGYPKLNAGDEFEVKISDLTSGSRSLILLACDYCGIQYKREFSAIQKSKNHFCSVGCSDKYKIGKEPYNKNKFLTECGNCNKEIERSRWETKRSNVLFCSRDCVNDYRKKHKIGRTKTKRKIKCSNCETTIERTPSRLESSKYHFCSKNCANIFKAGKPNMKNRRRLKVICHMCSNKFEVQNQIAINNHIHFCTKECRKLWKSTEEYAEIQKLNGKRQVKTITMICSNCNNSFEKSKSSYFGKRHFCSNNCRIEFMSRPENNSNPIKPKVEVSCLHCNKTKYINEAKFRTNKYHFCSRQCYWDWRSLNLKGKNSPNYNRIETKCDNCEIKIKVIPYEIEKNKHNFCSQVCYWKFRGKYYVGKKHPLFGKRLSEEQKSTMRKRIIKMYQDGIFDKQTSIQKKINGILEKMNVEYDNEFPCGYYLVDNYLADFNLMIEVMGDYWHSNPLTYESKGHLTDKQLDGIRRDKSKRTYIKRYHKINVLYLWESDINKRIELCEKLIAEYINNHGKLENYNSFNYHIDSIGDLKINDKIIKSYFEQK